LETRVRISESPTLALLGNTMRAAVLAMRTRKVPSLKLERMRPDICWPMAIWARRLNAFLPGIGNRDDGGGRVNWMDGLDGAGDIGPRQHVQLPMP
jgi:hypothetical protein